MRYRVGPEAVVARVALAVTLLILLCHASVAIAEILPDFTLDYEAWEATDVVVVDQTGVVLEVWKGTLKVKERLPVEEFKITSTAEVHYGLFREESDPPNDRVKQVTGKRRVLFLKTAAQVKSWKPASMHGTWDTATIWVERGEGFAWQQWMNPGPSLMRPLAREEALRKEIARVAEAQAAINAATSDSDLASWAKSLFTYIDDKNYRVRNVTADALKKCGPAVWPLIHSQLNDEAKLSIHSNLIHIAGSAAFEDALPVLEAIVREETKYWNGLSPHQLQGAEYTPPMHHHYYRLSACLFVMKRAGYADKTAVVGKLRDSWDANPVLKNLGSGGGKGRSPVLQYADEILKTE